MVNTAYNNIILVVSIVHFADFCYGKAMEYIELIIMHHASNIIDIDIQHTFIHKYLYSIF